MIGRGPFTGRPPDGAPDAEDMRKHVKARLQRFAETLYRSAAGSERSGQTTARQPEQSRTRLPGGAGYRHFSVQSTRHGDGDVAFWLYTPAQPVPREAPVIVFLHGWSAMDPRGYGAWIAHLVRRGNIVIYPVYQGSFHTPIPTTPFSALFAVNKALRYLGEAGGVRPDTERFALVGHSLGGALATQLAAVADKESLPTARAVMAVQPGRGERAVHPLPIIPLDTIRPETLLLLVTGSDDQVAGDHEARRIFVQTPQIAAGNKELVTVVSDDHGTPPLAANHASPRGIEMPRERPVGPFGINVRRADALSYYGYWKLFDGLTDAAFHGRHREYALGDTRPQRFMGLWSDGVPVTPLLVTKTVDPATVVEPDEDSGGFGAERRTFGRLRRSRYRRQ